MPRLPEDLLPVKGLVVAASSHQEHLLGVLRQAQISACFAGTIHSALNLLLNERPQFVLMEPWLEDGSVKQFVEELGRVIAVRPVPIIVWSEKPDHRTLSLVKQLNVAGFLKGKITNEAFQTKFNEVFRKHMKPHPFFIPISGKDTKGKAKISVKAAVLGKQNGRLLVGTSVAFVEGRVLDLHLNEGGDITGLVVKRCFRDGNSYIVELDYARAGADINEVVAVIADITMVPEGGEFLENRHRRVLWQNPDGDFAKVLRTKLEKHNIELIATKTLSDFRGKYAEGPGSYGCLYVNQLFNTKGKEDWIQDYYNRREDMRPPLIVATSESPPLSQGGVTFLEKPITVNDIYPIIVQQIESGRQHQKVTIEKGGAARPLAAVINLAVKVYGVDESFGILQANCEFASCIALVEHRALVQLWGGKNMVEVVETVPDLNAIGEYLVRFRHPVMTSTNKEKFWGELYALFRPKSVKNIAKISDADLGDDKLFEYVVAGCMESLESFAKMVPVPGKKVKSADDKLIKGFINGYVVIETSRYQGHVILACDQNVISHLAHLVTGTPEKEVSFDIRRLKQAMQQICEAVVGKARFNLRLSGIQLKVNPAMISMGQPVISKSLGHTWTTSLKLRRGLLLVQMAASEKGVPKKDLPEAG